MSVLMHADGYKLSHKKFMEGGCTMLYINLTARSGKYFKFQDAEKRVVFIGLQNFIKNVLMKEFNDFFVRPKDEAIAEFKELVDGYLGVDAIPMDHFEALHDLGYVPLEIKALPEGSKVTLKVPLVTVKNTHPGFAWLVTYIETVMSNELWPVIQSATTAYQYLVLCNRFADETVGNRNHVMFQCHDFSARGLMGREATALVGMGHLASFKGTDTPYAIHNLKKNYNATGFIGASVPASEHSVTSLGIAVKGELETIRYWIEEAYPSGIVSVVSDTIDFWRVVTEYLPALKDVIEARPIDANGNSRVVVRPDSGDPVRIICGYREDELYRFNGEVFSRTGDILTEDEVKGAIQVLFEKFGATTNKFGYRELNPHIGLIYGDSITIERAEEIFRRLQQRGFASNNVVFGVGSYTYQMATRDSLGIAVKATAAVVNGDLVPLFKDPKTDDGTKRSARGLLRVEKEGSEYVLYDMQTPAEELEGCLEFVFADSILYRDDVWADIVNRVHDITPANG